MARRSDIPFNTDDAHRILPLITMCLVAFMALLLCLALSLFSGVNKQAHQLDASMQIELPMDGATPKDTLKEVVSALEANPAIDDFQVMDDVVMERLLRPWLGDGISLEALDLPVLIDVQLADKEISAAKLQAQLRRTAPRIMVQDRGMWMQHMARGAAVLQWLLVAVALMLVTCVGALVMLVARTSLKLHFQTISLLHMFGATDGYITGQFQRYHARHAAKYALIGAVIGGIVYALVGVIVDMAGSPLLPHVSLGSEHLLLLLSLPVITALVARMAARSTVQHMLHHMH